MRAESLAFLKELIAAPSPSGYEEPAARVYRAYAESFADEVTTDRHGNITAVLNPAAEQKIMLAGHIDEIGFQVNYIDDKGLVYFRGVGGHDSMIPLGHRVWIHGKQRVMGVIGRKPIHLLEDKERNTRPELHDLWIDIGVSSAEEAKEFISIGDPVTYIYEFEELLNGRAVARGFDNRIGSWVVIEALRRLKQEGGLDPNVGVYAVATVQEEIGLRGARTAAHRIGAQSGLAVDVTFAIDHPGVAKTRYGECNIGGGPTITRGANINPHVFRMLQEAGEKEGVTIQIEAEPGGTGTDANAMQIAGDAMATGLVGVPLRYMHTPCELLALSDADGAAQLMAGYCRLVSATTDFIP